MKDEVRESLPEDLEKIFKRLYRVETSRNKEDRWTWIRTLRLHANLSPSTEWRITAESQYGLGSRI